MTRTITCIVCPRGCRMTAELTPQGISVQGHACPRGARHAVDECTNPVRTLTTTVAVENRGVRLAVKTAAPIPKGELFSVMERLRALRPAAPIRVGDVLLEDVCGTCVVAAGEVL